MIAVLFPNVNKIKNPLVFENHSHIDMDKEKE